MRRHQLIVVEVTDVVGHWIGVSGDLDEDLIWKGWVLVGHCCGSWYSSASVMIMRDCNGGICVAG